MTPIRASDGTWSWDRSEILLAGFEATGFTCECGKVSLGTVQRLARELDVTMSSLQAWRLTCGTWEYFLIPGWTKGFCGSPLLGF